MDKMIGIPDEKGVTFSKKLENGHSYTFRIEYDKVYSDNTLYKKGCFDEWLTDNKIEVPQDKNNKD